MAGSPFYSSSTPLKKIKRTKRVEDIWINNKQEIIIDIDKSTKPKWYWNSVT